MTNNIKNASYNALGFIFPLSVTLFTTPYIVHKLTPTIYGIYILGISLMGLMSFFDLGFGQGIIRFVSYYKAKNDHERINKIIAVSLIIYLLMGFIGSTLMFSMSDLLVKSVFKIPEKYVSMASLAFHIVAFGFMFNLIKGVFLNIPKALQRYDISVKILNSVWFSSIISSVLLLYFGKGLVAILISHVFFQFLGIIAFVVASKKLLPTLQIRLMFDYGIFKEIFSFSAVTAINDIAGKIVFSIDKIIIGAFLGAEAVTFYQVPFMLVKMSNGLTNSLSQSLFPAVSYIQSLGNKEKLFHIYIKSVRFVVSLSLIFSVAIILLGESFLSLWMGKDFADKATVIIPILCIVFFFHSISVVWFWFYNGLGKVKVNMYSSLVGVSFYLLSSVYFIPKYGLLGAAIAFAFTLVPFPWYMNILHRLFKAKIEWLIVIIAKSSIILMLAILSKYFISIPIDLKWLIFLGFILLIFSVLITIILKILYWKDLFELINKLNFWKVKS